MTTIGDQVREQVMKASCKMRTWVEAVTTIFPEYAAELADLPPAFWMAIGLLKGARVYSGDAQVLCDLVIEMQRTFGAPGDFGYGTPCGDALRGLYEAAEDCRCTFRACEGIADDARRE